MPTSAPKPRSAKADALVNDCIYQIATGAWKPGDRLPSLRDAKSKWGINEVTCFRVYRRLVDDGLVVPRDRGGYFIAASPAVDQLARDADRLRDLFTWFQRGVLARRGSSVLGAARALCQMAEVHAAAHPPCAFVECTSFQAESHAAQVHEQLRFPCAARTTDDLARRNIPPSVRFLLTTQFHRREVDRAAKSLGIPSLAVGVELDPMLIESLRRTRAPQIVVFGLKEGLAQSAAADLRRCLPSRRIRPHASNASALPRDIKIMSQTPGQAFVLSPSLWSGAAPDIRERADARPLQYRIVPSAWDTISRLLGLPAGPTPDAQESPVRCHA
ncbi:MAG: GntR family transcriptional regulator [Phycisphaerales bacterium]